MSAAVFDRVIGRLVKRGRLEVVHHDARRSSFGASAPGFPEVRVRFTDPEVTREILLDPRLGLAEAYMDGRLLIERGDVMELLQLLHANRPFEEGDDLARPVLVRRITRGLTFLYESYNRASSAKRNAAHHYDIGNDLYRLMLDTEHMQYSCAYWPCEDMTLEEAQEAKLAHIAAKLALAPGQRVLDIGCGWGGMAIYLARHAEVEVLGITLSEEQVRLARERVSAAGVADRVRIELLDYRKLASRREAFDRIVSVGMFEHVGRPQYGTFFRCCARMLASDGVMLLHTIGRMGVPANTDAFTAKYIFPGGYIPALSEVAPASEKAHLILSDVEILRLHYARTLREWYARCQAHRDAIVAMHDEKFFRMWSFYLAGATAAFESGGLCNYQIQYTRNRHALPLTREYLREGELDLLHQDDWPVATAVRG
jgi:cyclopropane-fatty-acyl-phospholipid synthase